LFKKTITEEIILSRKMKDVATSLVICQQISHVTKDHNLKNKNVIL
jgi:hypothetical protein